MARLVGGILASLSVCFFVGAHPRAASRLDQIRARGVVTCGVGPGVPGFSEVDTQGRYSGFDVDICRALSAAIFGQPDRVRFLITATIQDFLKATDIDLVSRRLTWTLTREGLGVLFGPVMLRPGSGFPRSLATHIMIPRGLCALITLRDADAPAQRSARSDVIT